MVDGLSDDELEQKVSELRIWGFEAGKLATRVEFEEEDNAVLFANMVLSMTKDGSHSPEVKVDNDAVEIDIWTPDIGITQEDVDTADRIEKKLRQEGLE